jgi:hypothetical protein
VRIRLVPSGALRSLVRCRGRDFLVRSWSSRSASQPRRRAASTCSRRVGRRGLSAGYALRLALARCIVSGCCGNARTAVSRRR